MKKFFGLLIFALGAFLLTSEIIIPHIAEVQEVARVKSELSTTPAAVVETSPATTPVAEFVEETEATEPTVDYFSTLLGAERNSTVGAIEGPQIRATLTLGADDNSDIRDSVGIHEWLSSNDRLVLFGHHMSNGTIFAHLPQTEVGDKFVITTANGTFNFTVISSEWVSVEEIEASDFEMLRNDHNLTMISCDWKDGVKGRRVVICDIDINM